MFRQQRLNRTLKPPFRRQQGATLIIALVVLAVMTVLGISTMKSATLQERMASNHRQKIIARNAAESALREAERRLAVNMTSKTSIYNAIAVPGSVVMDAMGLALYSDVVLDASFSVAPFHPKPLSNVFTDLSDDQDWLLLANLASSVAVENLSDEWAYPPRFVIEYFGESREPGRFASLDDSAGGGDAYPQVFRVTAIGWSQNPNIYSVLQSTFFTGSANFQ
ncbi:MAG: hypothetical protein COA42_20200 [Alteromonadaceae bacterium]|nr:MAG: hypothetical protein COA42_20200 [Alteromonadaceae bacterium]